VKTVLLIPARYGSSRFAGKPLALINGKPMIQHVFERAGRAEGIDEIYIATDDERIAEAARSFSAEVIMTGADAESGTDRINDAALQLGLNDADLIVNLQGDQPLVDPRSLEQVIQLFNADPGAFEMATLAYEITDPSERDDPKHVKMVFDEDDYALYFSRSCIPFGRDTSDYPVYKHLGIYAYTRRFVANFASLPLGRLENLEKLEQLRALEFGHRIKIAVSPYDSIEVDTPEDILSCEKFLSQA
jgi:3-deoxy-manno-octulosonate cytidylyltransferase (CMP-KDO synthetase)